MNMRKLQIYSHIVNNSKYNTIIIIIIINFFKNSVLFLNGDDPFLFRAESFDVPFKVLSFGIDTPELDFLFSNTY